MIRLLCALALLTLASVRAGEDEFAASHKAAIVACISYCRAQEIYRRTDYDRDGVLEYAQALHGGLKPPPPLELAGLPKPAPDEKTAIAQLIASLGNDQFDAREKAFADLGRFGPKALEQLQQAATGGNDPEVVQRANKLIHIVTLSLRPAQNANSSFGLYSSGRPGVPEGDTRLIAQEFADAECRIGCDLKNTPAKDGYLFRVLTQQGPSAAGGIRDFIANGNMTGGYALLAFPKEYGSNGKKVFMVSNQGIVFQRDFGGPAATQAFVEKCLEFNPLPGWTPVQ